MTQDGSDTRTECMLARKENTEQERMENISMLLWTHNFAASASTTKKQQKYSPLGGHKAYHGTEQFIFLVEKRA